MVPFRQKLRVLLNINSKKGLIPIRISIFVVWPKFKWKIRKVSTEVWMFSMRNVKPFIRNRKCVLFGAKLREETVAKSCTSLRFVMLKRYWNSQWSKDSATGPNVWHLSLYLSTKKQVSFLIKFKHWCTFSTCSITVSPSKKENTCAAVHLKYNYHTWKTSQMMLSILQLCFEAYEYGSCKFVFQGHFRLLSFLLWLNVF